MHPILSLLLVFLLQKHFSNVWIFYYIKNKIKPFYKSTLANNLVISIHC